MPKIALVAVLDWGLGHATRCVPVISELLKQKVTVVIAGNGSSLKLLQLEFPQLKSYELPAYNIKYSITGKVIFKLLKQLPGFFKTIRCEQICVGEIITKEKIDFIISDNRYGCYSKDIKSIFIGHQLNLILPKGLELFSSWVNSQHLKLLSKFKEVWIPDNESGFRFSGELSKTSLAVKHIGILSRFKRHIDQISTHYKYVAIVSGPEPQRKIFEDIIRTQLLKSDKISLLIKGLPGSDEEIRSNNLTELNHLSSQKLNKIIQSADVIISRSGYSSIMDFAVLEKKAILVPTPGQTEQAYLAEYLQENKMAVIQHQNNFNLDNALLQLSQINNLPETIPNSALSKAIATLL